MAYLTLDEYTNFGFDSLDDAVFDKFLARASMEVDRLTNQFYHYHDLETDKTFRQTPFKQALAYQIEFMNQNGIMSAADVANRPTSTSVGDTSVNLGNGLSLTGSSGTFLSQDAFNLLKSTGLLYQGVGIGGGRRCHY